MPKTDSITNDDFKNHRLTYEVLPVEIIDYVGSIHIRDSLAYFTNMTGYEMISIYDLNNNKRLGAAIKKGRGPNELAGFVWRLQMNDHQNLATVFDGEGNMVMTFPLDVITRVAHGDTNRVFTPYSKFEPKRIQTIIAIDTNIFVALNTHRFDATVDHRFTFYDREGNIVSEKGSFYKTPEMKFPDDLNSFAFYGGLICRYDGKRIVVFNGATDQLEIYDDQADLIKLVKGPDYFVPDIVRIDKNKTTRISLGEKNRDSYLDSKAKEKSFWAVYSGHNSHTQGMENKETTILSFDWDGKPLDKYIIPAKITNFDVDEANGLLYGIIMTDEGEQKIIKAKYR